MIEKAFTSLALSAGRLWPAAILDLRLLGLVMRRRPVTQVAAQFLPWTWTGFVVMILSGVVLFASEAVKCYNSPFFRVKVILLGVAGVNALIFHNTVFRNVDAVDNALTPWQRARPRRRIFLASWYGSAWSPWDGRSPTLE